MLAKRKKSTEFVSISQIILRNCKFISETTLHLASGSLRKKKEIS